MMKSPDGNMKADFTGVSLDGEWTFEKSYIGTIHTRW